MPTVLIPALFRGPTLGRGEIETSGATVLDCIEQVEQESPGFLSLVLDDGGGIHHSVRLFVNGEQIDSESLDMPVSDGDRIEVLAAIAGG